MGNEVQRREAAVRAAVEVASRYGLAVESPQVLKDSNNTIVHLAPAPVVAKVATTTLPRHEQALERELSVLRHLAGTHAAAVRPSGLLDPGPHEAEGHRLIFLDYLAHDAAAVDAQAAADALGALHEALGTYTCPLPRYTDVMDQARTVLADVTTSPALPATERAFLISAHDQLRARLPFGPSGWQALHGDPWEGGNLLSTPDGPVLVDFEAACVGPVEWDYSALDSAVADAALAPLDLGLLDLLRDWRSLTVSAFCWRQMGRAPEIDEAAHWHLQHLHSRLGR